MASTNKMTDSVEKTSSGRQYKVKDMSQADFGRLEIELAEAEMPGLTACRTEFGSQQPFKGAKIAGSLHMTIQTAVLIETLTALGAEVRWCSCNIFSTQDHAAAAIARDTCPVFAWKGETLEEYWWCTEQMLTWPDGSGPDLIVDDGGDATLLIHEGQKAEAAYKKDGTVPDPSSTDNPEFKLVLSIIKETLKKDDQKHSLPDGIMRATDVMLAGKAVFVAGYGDVGKGSAAAMKAAGARVFIGEIDPICALQATMEGYTVLPLDDCLDTCDVFVTTTGNKDIIMATHMSKMKNNAIVGNIGHFDNEIDMAGLMEWQGIKRQNIKPQCDRFIFPDGHGVIVLAEGRLLNLGCATGHPSFVIAQLELWNERKSGRYEHKVYVLPKHLDEKVAALHLPKLGAKLTKLTADQAKYINVPVTGPFKPAHYRY
ncbi:hypothetical protein WJX79_008161 [Trebouxia sp. C0005]